MLKPLDSVTEIDEYFVELETKANWRMQRARIYGMAQEYQEQREYEKKIEEQVESQYRRILKTTIISDDLAIVEAQSTHSKGKEINYYPVVMGKFYNESCMTFDEALVLAISRKYNQPNYAPAMIYNMLRMDLANK